MRIELISCARAGSSYYGDIIKNLTPEGPHYAEPEFTQEFIDQASNSYYTSVKFHAAKYRNYVNSDLYPQYDKLDWYKIGLVRTDLFEQSLSFAITKTRKNRHGNYYEEKLTIDEYVFYNCVKSRIEEIEWIKQFLPRCQDVLRYEELFGMAYYDAQYYGPVKHGLIEVPPNFSQEYNASPDKKSRVTNYNDLQQLFESQFSKQAKEIIEWWHDEYAYK